MREYRRRHTKPPAGYELISDLFRAEVERINAGATKAKLADFVQHCAREIAVGIADKTITIYHGRNRAERDNGAYWKQSPHGHFAWRHTLWTGFYWRAALFDLSGKSCFARDDDMRRLGENFRQRWKEEERASVKRKRGNQPHPLKTLIVDEYNSNYATYSKLSDKDLVKKLMASLSAVDPGNRPPKFHTVRDWIKRQNRKRWPKKAAITEAPLRRGGNA